jgi:hypothetical protein
MMCAIRDHFAAMIAFSYEEMVFGIPVLQVLTQSVGQFPDAAIRPDIFLRGPDRAHPRSLACHGPHPKRPDLPMNRAIYAQCLLPNCPLMGD